MPVRIGRQGIYDAERELAAYELLFRAHGGLHAGLTSEREQEKATSQVISATFGDFGVEQIAGDLPLFINLTRSFFTGDLPIPCEPGQVVLELLEDILVDDEVIAGVRALAGRGYRIAVDDFAGEEHRWPAVRLADYVKIDISQTGDRFPDVLRLARGLNPDAPIVVERVEDEETFDACRDQGVDLYQGYLLQRPVVLESVSLSPSQVICLKLVRALTGDEAPIEEIERLVASDPGMSVRVLRTVRSAAVGTSRQITSLRQAIALLGRRQLCSWVVLMLLGGVTRSDPEALTLVLARATACARLVEPGGQVDVAYTVGLLSGVARVLRISDEELIETTGVAPVVRAALLNHEGPAGRALAAVLGYEDEDLPRVSGAGHELYEVSRAYLAALSGAMATVSLVTRGSAA
ncbi:EAL and HDOD domain-containing protein [Kineococcus xinjiangensis]|uniref:EAL and HDOD domain-containing protein n=1 Tax=Kineococcus xinjiangensis TaxID=512762 RepID=UPI0011AFD3F1|nr:HDOD domain-containing protein [Kineococcus xinjiangensis]